MKKLPIKAASDLGKKYDLDRVLIIASSTKHDRTYTVSWGKTKEDCGFAAMDIQKLRAVIEVQPTSLADAVEVAKRIRPQNVEGVTDYKDLIDRLLELISYLDPGWNSITTPDVVVEAAALVAEIKD